MLINLRNALMTGKRLPYDAEVEFLQSSGAQFIDTLVNADSNLSVEITMANAGVPWTNVNPVGVILVTPRCRHHLNFDSTLHSNGVNYYFGNGDSCVVTSGYRPADGEVFTFKVDAISKTFTLGSFLGTFPNDTFDTGLSYWLFGRNGTTPPYFGSLRIYSAKLWNGSILVRDYIPVRRGAVGYLYDRVSGKLFGNAGTGDFVVGQDVVPVEWLESSGTEYIDTGVAPQPNLDYSATFSTQSASLYYRIFGAWTNSNQKRFGAIVSAQNLLYQQMTPHGEITSVYTSPDVVTFEKRGLSCYVNGIRAGSFSSDIEAGEITDSLLLFAINTNGSAIAAVSELRISAFSLTLNSTPLRRFRPVRVGTEGAMMDVLTRRVYRNAGTGAFTYGNDLKYPIPAE